MEDVIFPFTAAEGGFGCENWEGKNAEVFTEGQAALLDCWETLLGKVEEFSDQNHRIYSYKSILQSLSLFFVFFHFSSFFSHHLSHSYLPR